LECPLHRITQHGDDDRIGYASGRVRSCVGALVIRRRLVDEHPVGAMEEGVVAGVIVIGEEELGLRSDHAGKTDLGVGREDLLEPCGTAPLPADDDQVAVYRHVRSSTM
jgi:hypothetical protein